MNMKKLIAGVMAAMLVVSSGMTSVFAASSKTDLVEITKVYDGAGEDVDYTLEAIDEDVRLTEEEAAEIIGDVEASELTILWQRDVKAEKLPATIEFRIDALEDNQDVYVFHYKDGEWMIEAKGAGKDISCKFDDLSPVALVAKNGGKRFEVTPEQAGDTGRADAENVPTGDNASIYFWGALMAVAAVGTGVTIFAAKKVRKQDE